jgi:CDP-diacylglycerol--glycerol-3-phosphate 3-phosphatidyltransferase
VSSFGAFLDPVADKLMVAAALVLLCTKGPAGRVGVTLQFAPKSVLISVAQ